MLSHYFYVILCNNSIAIRRRTHRSAPTYMKKTIIIYTILSLTLITGHIKAQTIIGPLPQYTIELKVANDEPGARKQAFSEALKQLLIRNTNNPEIINQEPTKTAITNVEKYIQRYTYINQKGLFLQVRFIPKSVAQLLRSEQSETITIRVYNVSGLEQYNELIMYLKTFDQITKIDSPNISASMVELKLSISGDQKDLLAIIGSQGKLIKEPGSRGLTPRRDNSDLEYKWLTAPNEQLQTTSTKPVS